MDCFCLYTSTVQVFGYFISAVLGTSEYEGCFYSLVFQQM